MRTVVLGAAAAALLWTFPAGAQESTRKVARFSDSDGSVTVNTYTEAGAVFAELEAVSDPWVDWVRWTPSEAAVWLAVADSIAGIHPPVRRDEKISFRAPRPFRPSLSRDVTRDGDTWYIGFEDHDGMYFSVVLPGGAFRRFEAAVRKAASAKP